MGVNDIIVLTMEEMRLLESVAQRSPTFPRLGGSPLRTARFIHDITSCARSTQERLMLHNMHASITYRISHLVPTSTKWCIHIPADTCTVFSGSVHIIPLIHDIHLNLEWEPHLLSAGMLTSVSGGCIGITVPPAGSFVEII